MSCISFGRFTERTDRNKFKQKMSKRNTEMEKAELIFVPLPAVSHLVSALEFAKRLIDRDDRISITILVFKFPLGSFVDAYTESLIASQPKIKLVELPQVDPPPDKLRQIVPARYICDFVESHIPNVRNVVADIMKSSKSSSGSIRVAGLVIDIFCVSLIDVANEFCLPSYIISSCGAGFIDLMLYLPKLHIQVGKAFENSDPEILMPGFVNPVPLSVLPRALFNKEYGYDTYIQIAQKLRNAKGIMVNTCIEFEPYTINSFLYSQGPPVYAVGPNVCLNSQPHPDLDIAQFDRIVKWLDDQPDSSVVFLCFGSFARGSFDANQVREIAHGLELAGYRFLWSMRVPPPKDHEASSSGTSHYKNPEQILPEGFLEKIRGRGMICGWVSQVQVLAHKAIGGFISHCGWNSILESLWFGVPIVTWPVSAEQQLNAFSMVRELQLAVELRLDYTKDSGLVMADEIERATRFLMEGENEVRKKVKDLTEIARKAVMDGGSSFVTIGQLIDDMMSYASL